MSSTLCEHCGYDLAGLPIQEGTFTCPECRTHTRPGTSQRLRIDWQALPLALGIGAIPAVASHIFSRNVDMFIADFVPPLIGGFLAGLVTAIVLVLRSRHRYSRGLHWTECVAVICTHTLWLAPAFIVPTMLAAMVFVFSHRSYC